MRAPAADAPADGGRGAVRAARYWQVIVIVFATGGMLSR